MGKEEKSWYFHVLIACNSSDPKTWSRKGGTSAEKVKDCLEEALNELSFAPQKGAPILKKLINSAVANANQYPDIDVDNLFIKNVFADEGPMLKRFRPRAMGRATRIRKRTSHLTVILDEN